MRIVVFGATGGSGRHVVERALAGGHDVVAVARRPEAVATKHERLTVTRGDVLDAAAVAAAVAGADAVVSTVGPADNKRPGTLISDGIRNMVDACARAGVRRLVFESGLMVGDGRALAPVGRLAVAFFRRVYRALCEDKRKAEATLRASDLEWVIVRPPTLVDGPARGGYKFGVDLRTNPAKKMAHADVAELLVKVAVEPGFARQVLEAGY